MADNLTIVNIYNFIRKSIYADGEFVQEDFDTVKNQIEILKQYELPSTYAIKYDALMDQCYVDLIKQNIDEYDEVGVWWEITKDIADKANVKWKGKNSDKIDLNVKVGYSLAYTAEERKALIDVYMEDFKAIFGYYPKSVASWVLDIVSFEYFRNKYGVVAGGLCRDQIGTDGFTLWGGYFNGAYYPSKVNENIPAQTLGNQLDLPIFKLLGPDPIYNFESGLRPGVNAIYSLEPAWLTGKNKEWIEWIFKKLTEEPVLGYSYAQVGQENSFLWENIVGGFETQIKHISKLAKENKVRVETLEESAKWFKQKYRLTPPTTYTASDDWNKEFNLKTTWYESRFYRTSFLWENNEMSIRDLFIFDENYVSRYIDESIETNESIFDALPILNAQYWSTDEKRASIDVVSLTDNRITPLKGKQPQFFAVGNNEFDIVWETDNNAVLKVYCEENKMTFEMVSNNNFEWGLCINTLPVLRKITETSICCRHNNFDYNIGIVDGEFKLKDESVMIVPNKNKFMLILSQKDVQGDNEFFQEDYIENPKCVDNFIPRYKQVQSKSRKEPKPIKPVITPGNAVKKYGEREYFTIENVNETGVIRYTTDLTEPDGNSSIYKEPILIDRRTTIKAKVFKDSNSISDTVEADFYNTLQIKDIKSFNKFEQRKIFNRNGAWDLIDGKIGSHDYIDNCWLGTTEDLHVIVDLGKEQEVHNISIGFMHNTRSGPAYPEYIEFAVSYDGVNFSVIDKIICNSGKPEREIETLRFNAKCNCKARYIKVYAKNRETYPEWSNHAGLSPVFLFADQIIVE